MLFDHFINLSLRHDRYVIPSALLNAHVAEAEREYLRENEKKKLSKFEKKTSRTWSSGDSRSSSCRECASST